MDLAKESVYWGIRIMIISIAIIFIILILGSLTNYNIYVDKVESYVIRNKIISDENCLAYHDYRTNLGTIDKNKFNKNNIANCLNTDKGIILDLTYNKNSEQILINEDLADKKSFCFDEETFSCIKEEYNLILMDNSNKISAKLIIETIDLK